MTDKLKKNTFITGWTKLIHGAKSPSTLSRKAIELTIKDLCSSKENIRQDASLFFLNNDYIAICGIAGVDHCELRTSVSAMLNDTGARKKKMADNIIKQLRERSK